MLLDLVTQITMGGIYNQEYINVLLIPQMNVCTLLCLIKEATLLTT